MFKMNQDLMKVVITKVEKLAKEKKNLAILNGVLVEVEENFVHFTASNGTDTVRHSAPVEDGIVVYETGTFILPSLALNAMSKLKDIEISLTDRHIVVTEVSEVSAAKKKGDKQSNAFNFSKLGDVDEFPKFGTFTKENSVKFIGQDFQNIIQKVIITCSKSETRPILTGVLMKFTEDSTELFSTDSHQLSAIKTKGVLQGDTKEMSVVIPESSLTNMLKALDFEKEVFCYPSQQNLAIENGNTIYISRLLEGNFPDVSRLIPNGYESKVVINKSELMNTLDILKTLGSKSVKMSVDNMFVSFSSNNEIANASRELAHELWESETENFDISFNIEFLTNMVKVMDSKSVLFEFNGNMRPFLLKYQEEEVQANMDELHLLLPIRTA